MITVYHGSNVLVKEPLVGIGRENLDFGLGFYVTALMEQADTWAANKARYNMQPEGYVSLYEFDKEAAVVAFRYHKFEAYDRDWLHFIVDNRDGGNQWRQWDIIEGGVANDRYLRFTDSYKVKAYAE